MEYTIIIEDKDLGLQLKEIVHDTLINVKEEIQLAPNNLARDISYINISDLSYTN